MSEPSEIDSVPPELPRLRIHHLLVLTAIFSLVLAMQMGLMRLIGSSPNTVVQGITGGISIPIISGCLSVSCYCTVVLFGISWRKHGIAFPSQPGHWLALYFAFAYLHSLLLIFPSLVPHNGYAYATMLWLMRIVALIFHGILVVFWSFAYRRENVRIWKWGWVAMALRSLFLTLQWAAIIVALAIQWVLETFWYSHYSLTQWLTLPLEPIRSLLENDTRQLCMHRFLCRSDGFRCPTPSSSALVALAGGHIRMCIGRDFGGLLPLGFGRISLTRWKIE